MKGKQCIKIWEVHRWKKGDIHISDKSKAGMLNRKQETNQQQWYGMTVRMRILHANIISAKKCGKSDFEQYRPWDE